MFSNERKMFLRKIQNCIDKYLFVRIIVYIRTEVQTNPFERSLTYVRDFQQNQSIGEKVL